LPLAPETITTRDARRLALARAGLLKPEWTGMPARASGGGKRARSAALTILDRFGYLQLDTVAVAGARSHALVLMSRLEGMDPALGEALLQPGEPVFEYWGHEACWLPLDLYPAFEFRRQEFRVHPWWGDLLGAHPEVADRLLERIDREGPLRSVDMDGAGGAGWWNLKTMKKVATALWSSGELAILERRNFQRSYDLVERVIPASVRSRPLPEAEGLKVLLLRALEGHGWATTGTLAATWRLRNRQAGIRAALAALREQGAIMPCALENPGENPGGRPTAGWIRPADLDLADRLERVRPREDRGVLLSPFDPVLWDRARTARLFGFDQALEIFKPAPRRVFGYFCLPVLAGDCLVARVDLKAERAAGRLRVLSLHYEGDDPRRAPSAAVKEAVGSAIARHADALGLDVRIRP
jgi:uncharacterized protein YcaQ